MSYEELIAADLTAVTESYNTVDCIASLVVLVLYMNDVACDRLCIYVYSSGSNGLDLSTRVGFSNFWRYVHLLYFYMCTLPRDVP